MTFTVLSPFFFLSKFATHPFQPFRRYSLHKTVASADCNILLAATSVSPLFPATSLQLRALTIFLFHRSLPISTNETTRHQSNSTISFIDCYVLLAATIVSYISDSLILFIDSCDIVATQTLTILFFIIIRYPSLPT